MEGNLDCHIHGIICKPVCILITECSITRIVRKICTIEGFLQKQEPAIEETAIIDIPALWNFFFSELFFRKKTLFHQAYRIDEIRIPGEGGEGLIGRISVTGRAKRQDLPIGLTCIFQEIYKLVCFPGEAAYSIFAGQAKDGEKYSACSHGILFLSSLKFAFHRTRKLLFNSVVRYHLLGTFSIPFLQLFSQVLFSKVFRYFYW